MQTRWSDGRLLIRPYRPDDADALYTAVYDSLAELEPWLPWAHAGYDRAAAASWIAYAEGAWTEGVEFPFAVTDAASGRILGGTGINQLIPEHRIGHIGYWTRTDAAGQGIASAACRLGARFGFEALGLQRLGIVMALGNAASRRVAEKAGAQYEGIARNRIRTRNRAQDAHVYALVPSDLGMTPTEPA